MPDEKKEKQPVELTATCEVSGILYALCFDAGSSTVYGAGTDWSVYRVDATDEKPTARKAWTHHENYVSSLAWKNGEVISGGYDRRLMWTNAESGQVVRSVDDAHSGWIREIVISTNGGQLVSVADDMLAKVWDAESGELLHTLEAHARQTPQGFASALYGAAISPDGRVIATADRIGDVCLWESATGKLIRRLQAPKFYTYDATKRSRSIGGIRSVSFSPDGDLLALSGIGAVTNVDGFVGPARVEVWNWQTGERTFAAEEKHKAVLNDVVFHSTKPLLVAAGGGDSGGLLAVWNTSTQKIEHKVKPKGHLQKFALTANGQQLYAAGHNGFQFWTLHA